jgi:endonuclease/exonuclease/phosphatase family metal-dependent hydrolase
MPGMASANTADRRAEQMEYLRDFLLAEYEKGNFVLVGGYWNQTPHGLTAELPDHIFDQENLTYIEKDYPAADWIWAFDPALPTNRRVKTPYDQASSLTTIIDFYLLSPNLKVLEVQTVDMGFEYSDHQPVQLSVSFLPQP